MMQKMRDRKGFTLVEIMIVVLIIGILLAIAIPNFIKARETSRTKSCVSNLKQIDAAKEQWAMDNKQPEGAACTAADIDPYIKGGVPTQCPADSASGYDVNAIGTNPTCQSGITGHTL